MLLNSWQCITLICGNHGDDHTNEMHLKKGPHSLFYSCPKYHSIYSKEEQAGISCNNRLTLVDYERLLDYLTEKARGEFGSEVDLTGLRWKDKGVEYHVLEHRNGKFTVKMLNVKAINRK